MAKTRFRLILKIGGTHKVASFHNAETRAKMSAAHVGLKHSPETRTKISAALRMISGQH